MEVLQFSSFLLLLTIASTIAEVKDYDDNPDILVQKYENLILDEEKKAESYVPRTNASAFRHTNTVPLGKWRVILT